MAFLLLHNYTDFIHIPIRVQNIQVVLISRYVTFDFKRKVKVFMFVLVLNYFALDDTYF